MLALALLASALLSSPVHAACVPAKKGEPVRIHVLTTSPGGQVFNSQGHSAIWISGGSFENDMVYNWGAFDGRRPDLLPAFLSGRMEFWLAGEVYEVQWKRTQMGDRTLVAQQLMLPPGAGERIANMLLKEAKPENRDYIYHYANNNCATRVRDVVDQAIGGELKSQTMGIVDWTGRFDGGRNLAPWPHVWFAWDFMVSRYLDQPLTEWDAGMVPERLMATLEKITYTKGWDDGAPRKLVKETCLLRKGGYSWAREEPLPYWPITLGSLAASGLLFGLGRMRQTSRLMGRLAAVIAGPPLLFLAFLGTATFGLWAMSDLEGVGPSENWLLGSPLTWLLVGPLVALLRGRPMGSIARKSAFLLAVIGVLAVLVKPIPGFDQQNLGPISVWLPMLLAVAGLAYLDRNQDA